MPYSTPEKQRAYNRSAARRKYNREYKRNHPQKYSPNKVTRGTSIGYKGEEIALKVLVGSKKIRKPCDLSWEGKLVDVKTAKPTITHSGTYRWKFLLSTQRQVVDLYLLIRKDIDDRVIDIHLIPNINKNNLSFNSSTVTKYKKYLLSL